MRPLLEVWLAAEGLILLAAAGTMIVPRGSSRRRVWLGVLVLMVMIASGALNAADRHSSEAGAEILRYAAVFLYGAAFAFGVTALRDRLARRGGQNEAPGVQGNQR